MLAKVYIETTVVSYLVARPNRDLRIAAHQEATAEWWDRRRQEFELHVSQLVIDEAAAGDREMATARLKRLEELPLLDVSDAAIALAERLMVDKAVPEQAEEDALHIAVAAVHGMDYLLTWNCKHIANATMRAKIEAVCLDAGYEAPVICTPEELLED